jgi:plasmid stabilization system protein ParE
LAEVVYTPASFDDFERILEFYAAGDPTVGAEMVERIREVVDTLTYHPYLGRPAEDGMRELVISRGKTGFVALYQYVEPKDLILILAIRHQREEGYPER